MNNFMFFFWEQFYVFFFFWKMLIEEQLLYSRDLTLSDSKLRGHMKVVCFLFYYSMFLYRYEHNSPDQSPTLNAWLWFSRSIWFMYFYNIILHPLCSIHCNMWNRTFYLLSAAPTKGPNIMLLSLPLSQISYNLVPEWPKYIQLLSQTTYHFRGKWL